MPNVVTVREAVKRAKQDGFPISEYTLRQWIKTGAIPVRKAGAKILIFYPKRSSLLMLREMQFYAKRRDSLTMWEKKEWIPKCMAAR